MKNNNVGFRLIKSLKNDSEPEILKEFRVSLQEAKDFNSGKKKSKTLEEILNLK